MSDEFKLIWMSVFSIDFNKDKCESGVDEIKDIYRNNEFSGFLKDQFLNIITDEKYKRFNYNSDSATIINLENILNSNNVETNSLEIANRLWQVERERNIKISKTLGTTLLKGVLVLAYVEYNGNFHFFILKIEHHNFFQDGNYEKNSGIPEDKAVLKSFYISYAECDTNKPYQLKIRDKASSAFWRRDFLDILEKFTNEKNVQECFDYLKRKIGIKFKNYKEDRDKLLNSTQYYFCSGREVFDLDDYFDTVCKKYKPISKNIVMEEVCEAWKLDIVENNRFDTYFNLSDVDDIEKKIKPIEYDIREGVTIKVSKSQKDKLSDIFESIEYNGKKGIIIYDPDSKVYSSYIRRDNDN